MKRFTLAALAAATMIGSGAHAAGSAAATFDVNLTLTPTCVIADTSGGATVTQLGTNISVAYSAFQATPGTGFTSFVVRCSTGLPISSVALDAASLTDGTTGLAYTLALKTANTGDASTPVASLGGGTGSASGTPYYVQAFVPAGQAGTTSPGVANKTRTVTVSY